MRAAAVATRAPGDAFVAGAEQREAARVREAVGRGRAQGQLLLEQWGARAQLIGDEGAGDCTLLRRHA